MAVRPKRSAAAAAAGERWAHLADGPTREAHNFVHFEYEPLCAVSPRVDASQVFLQPGAVLQVLHEVRRQ
jgi:hypothetical protein